MGFGLMLCGYFILTLMSFGMGQYRFAAYLIGGLISFVAAGKLYEYKHRFALCVGTSVGYLVLGVYEALAALDDMLLWGLPVFGGRVATVMGAVGYGVELLHVVAILWGTYELATSVGVEKLRSTALRNGVLTGIWAVGQAVLVAVPAVATFEEGTITKIILLVELIVYLLNCLMLFLAYQLICPVGEETGRDRAPSRIEWVNRLRAKREEQFDRTMAGAAAVRSEREKKKKDRNGKRRRRR